MGHRPTHRTRANSTREKEPKQRREREETPYRGGGPIGAKYNSKYNHFDKSINRLYLAT